MDGPQKLVFYKEALKKVWHHTMGTSRPVVFDL